MSARQTHTPTAPCDAEKAAPSGRRAGWSAMRALREAAALAAASAALFGAVALLAQIERKAPRETHGVVAVLFPPWMSEAEQLRRIDEAGGVAVISPSRPANGPYQRVIVDGAGFTPRARALGAWAVAPFAGP